MKINIDHKSASFMRGFRNMIPLPASTMNTMVARVKPFKCYRLYGPQGVVVRSTERYLSWLDGVNA